MKKMQFVREAYDDLINSVGSRKAETGGILLGSRDDFVVRKFIFDPYGSGSSAAYDPDVNYLNKVIKEEGEKNQLFLIGFAHSHPRSVNRLSGDWGNNTGDLGYIKAIFKAIEGLDKFLVPIIFPAVNGKNLEIFPYVAERGKEEAYEKYELEILDKDDHQSCDCGWGAVDWRKKKQETEPEATNTNAVHQTEISLTV